MFDVIVDGLAIARASTKQEENIYKLNYFGLDDEEIAKSLHVSKESVAKYTDSGKYR